MTRFGEISPLLQKFASLWQIFDSLFPIWQNAESTLAIFDIIGEIFIAENGQIMKTTIWSSGHAASLATKVIVWHHRLHKRAATV